MLGCWRGWWPPWWTTRYATAEVPGWPCAPVPTPIVSNSVWSTPDPEYPAPPSTGLFVPFQRLGDRSATVGVGLGLSVARGFTEAIGGTLSAEDTPGGGLTVVISLPAEVSTPSMPDASGSYT